VEAWKARPVEVACRSWVVNRGKEAGEAVSTPSAKVSSQAPLTWGVAVWGVVT